MTQKRSWGWRYARQTLWHCLSWLPLPHGMDFLTTWNLKVRQYFLIWCLAQFCHWIFSTKSIWIKKKKKKKKNILFRTQTLNIRQHPSCWMCPSPSDLPSWFWWKDPRRQSGPVVWHNAPINDFYYKILIMVFPILAQSHFTACNHDIRAWDAHRHSWMTQLKNK